MKIGGDGDQTWRTRCGSTGDDVNELSVQRITQMVAEILSMLIIIFNYFLCVLIEVRF